LNLPFVSARSLPLAGSFRRWRHGNCSFYDKPKLSKKFEPGPESVGFKHLYLSKIVVHQPKSASRKPPLGEDKKRYWNFLWFGYLYKIDRRQLVMSHLKEGLALTNVELKKKSLFWRANLFKKVEDFFVDRKDFLFVERNTIRLPRNVQEAFTSADEVLTRNLS
jgi:hypothetical protein